MAVLQIQCDYPPDLVFRRHDGNAIMAVRGHAFIGDLMVFIYAVSMHDLTFCCCAAAKTSTKRYSGANLLYLFIKPDMGF